MRGFVWQKIDETLQLDEVVLRLNRSMRALETVADSITKRVSKVTTIPNGRTTPSVYGSQVFVTANTLATNITQFVDGGIGHTFLLKAGDGNTTLVHGVGALRLRGAVNRLLANHESTQFFSLDGVEYWEVS